MREARPFGRSPALCVEIQLQSILKVARILKTGSAFEMDWLENLTVAEVGSHFVLTYFLRSFKQPHELILQASFDVSSLETTNIPSVRSVWEMAEPMEQEAEEMFGILFKNEDGQLIRQIHPTTPKILPEGWQGFPLRKDYLFPKEFAGISHSRVLRSTEEKKDNEESSQPCH